MSFTSNVYAMTELTVILPYRKKISNYLHRGSSVTLWIYEYMFSIWCINNNVRLLTGGIIK